MGSLRLNIGVGEHYAEGWINTDIHDLGPKPDVICSILDLPFPSGSVERVYLGHVLEHIAWENLPRALSEVLRVLTPDGKVAVVGPDVNRTGVYEPLLMEGVLHGGHRWPGDEHLWKSTGGKTRMAMSKAGFSAHLVPVFELSEEWPVVDRHAMWQFAIEAEAKES